MPATEAAKSAINSTINSATSTPQTGFLNILFFGNTLENWLLAILVATLVFVACRLARKYANIWLQHWATRTANHLDDLLLLLLRRTRFFFFLGVALLAGMELLSLSEKARTNTHKVILLSVVIQAALWANDALSFWIKEIAGKRSTQDGHQATTIMALGFIGKILLWVTAILVALDNLGMNVSTLVTGLGIGGVAVALAVQNILGDLFASLSIVLDKPFVVGDFVSVDAFSGTVEHIGLKTTRLRSLSGEQLVLSNTDLLKSRIRNFKRMTERRVAFLFEVVHATPVEKLMRIPRHVEEVVTSLDKTRFERTSLRDLGTNGVVFETIYHVLDPDYLVYANIHQMVNLGIISRLREEGVDLAYQTRTIILNGAQPQ